MPEALRLGTDLDAGRINDMDEQGTDMTSTVCHRQLRIRIRRHYRRP